MRPRASGPLLPDLRWSPMTALSGPRGSRLPFVLASLLVHLALILLGQRLVRPGGGGVGSGFLEAPAGVERAWPGMGGLPADMRFGVIDLDPATLPALGAPVRPAPPPEVAPAEVVVAPVDPPVEPATADAPGPANSPETVPAGDPAGSPAGGGGDAAGEGGPGGGGGEGGTGTGGGSGSGGAPALDFVRGRDTLPVVQSMTVPDYPPAAKGRSRVPVVLLVHVTAAGLVDDVRRGESTDCPPCETAAIASAWKLRFTPGTRDGVPVAMWVRYPVTFGRK